MTPEPDYPFAVSMVILAVLIIGATLAAARFYAQQLRGMARHDGLLLWHVLTIGVSVALTWAMLGLGGLDIMGVLTMPRWVRLAGYDAGGVGTFAAVSLIALLSRRRVHNPAQPVCPADTAALPADDGAPPTPDP